MAEASIIAFQLAEIIAAIIVVTVTTCTLVCGVLIAKRVLKSR
jgi:hypothetical protein